MSQAVDIPATIGQIVRVRSRQYLVEDVTAPPTPATTPSSASRASTTTPRASSSRSSGRGRSTRERSDEADWSKLGRGDFDPPSSSPRYSARSAGTASPRPTRLFQSPFAPASARRLPARAAAQGAAAAAGEPVHRRRRGPRQDDRGRPHRPRAADAPEGAAHRRRRAALGGAPVEGRAGAALRAHVRRLRPRLRPRMRRSAATG